MIKVDAILDDNPSARERSLDAIWAAPEHQRSAFSGQLMHVALEAASAVATSEEGTADAESHRTRLRRACVALSRLRVESAKKCLLRIADQGTRPVKEVLAESLRETPTTDGRAVLVYMLSDPEAWRAAISAIAVLPWPAVLPILIELAEADDRAARLALGAIARCGASSGVDESCAAATFLFELLDDEDELFEDALRELLRNGHALPGVVVQARRLARSAGAKKAAGLCLFAACGTEGTADLIELALAGQKTDKAAARTLLGPLLASDEEVVRSAAERTWRVLNLGEPPQK